MPSQQTKNATHTFRVTRRFSGEKIDRILAQELAPQKISRRAVRRFLDQGCVTVDQRTVRFASHKPLCGAVIAVRLNSAPPSRKMDEKHAPEILLRTDTVLALAKPQGLLSQPVSGVTQPSAVTWVRENIGENWLLCHRLDRETSGVLLFGAGRKHTETLMQMFRDRSMKKTYHALVWGNPSWKETERSSFLKTGEDGCVREVRSGGKPSKTRFEVLRRGELGCLIACYPETGRTHQIRVHLNALGHPIVGDKRYGFPDTHQQQLIEALGINHHMLHAYQLAFSERLVEAPKSKSFRRIERAILG